MGPTTIYQVSFNATIEGQHSYICWDLYITGDPSPSCFVAHMYLELFDHASSEFIYQFN